MQAFPYSNSAATLGNATGNDRASSPSNETVAADNPGHETKEKGVNRRG